MTKTQKMKNGVRLVTERVDSVESVAVGIWVKAGAVNESQSILGMSHLIEHMMFKGTEKRTARQIAADVDRIGAHINAFTGKESTCYYIRALGSNLRPACEILTDLFRKSTFDPGELEKEKDVIYEEIKMIEDAPDDDAHDILSELIFRGTPLESPIIGLRETLATISREAILDYLEREYSADSVVVSISGRFDEDAATELFEETLLGLRPEKEPLVWREETYQPLFRTKKKEVEQSHICLGRRGLAYEDELYYALNLLNSVFGGSMSSRLFQTIREEKGLAYSVYSAVQPHTVDGMFSIYAGVGHSKVEQTIDAVREELENLERRGITEEELATAKEQMKSSYVFGRENVSNRMFSNGKNELLLHRQRTPEEVLGKIDAVTMDDIRRATGLIASLAQYSGVVVGNRELNLAGLTGFAK